jgi:hypothetical protein
VFAEGGLLSQSEEDIMHHEGRTRFVTILV